jgi:hypothetical protein
MCIYEVPRICVYTRYLMYVCIYEVHRRAHTIKIHINTTHILYAHTHMRIHVLQRRKKTCFYMTLQPILVLLTHTRKRTQSIVDVLIRSCGADPNSVDVLNNTALHFAARKGHGYAVNMRVYIHTPV